MKRASGMRSNPSHWHGSSGLRLPFRSPLFVTADRDSARLYARDAVLGTGSGGVEPRVHEVDVRSDIRIFDIRRSEHRGIYEAIRRLVRDSSGDSDDWLPSLSSATGPLGLHFGHVRQLIPFLADDFDAILVDESGQSSLALLHPERDARLVGSYEPNTEGDDIAAARELFLRVRDEFLAAPRDYFVHQSASDIYAPIVSVSDVRGACAVEVFNDVDSWYSRARESFIHMREDWREDMTRIDSALRELQAFVLERLAADYWRVVR